MKFRWIWRYDATQRLVRVCVLENLVTAFKLSLALHAAAFRWHREWDGFFLTVLGVRVHYRRAHIIESFVSGVAPSSERSGTP